MENEKKKGISRRTFLKTTGAVATTAAIGGGIGLTTLAGDVEAAPADISKAEIFTSSCTMECLHHNLKAYVVDGKLVKVESCEADETVACLRGLARTQWVNHPERIKMPMLRDGEKGSNRWQEISWDEALDLIVEKIKETQAELGNQGICLRSFSGNFGSLSNAVAASFFNYLGGFTPVVGSLCCQAVTGSMTPIFGSRYEDTRDSIRDSRYLLAWGNNPAVTMQSYFKWYQEAQAKGAKMVTVDPRFSETAAQSDEWVPIIPGTDTALALGMIKIIIEENLYDADFIRAHSSLPFLVAETSGKPALQDEADPTSFLVLDEASGQITRHDGPGVVPALTVRNTAWASQYKTQFDILADECRPWTPEEVEKETDVPAASTIRMARDYATIKPAMLIQNMGGFQRTEWGSYAAAAHMYLAVLTGNIGGRGNGICDAGGVTTSIKVGNAIPSPKPQGEFGAVRGARFGRDILEDKPNKIGFLWTMTSSIMTQNPNTGAVKEALKKIPFVVTVDSLMTSTALYSDLVLPCTTIFESENVLASSRSHYVQLMEKAVDPPGEAHDDLWIFTQLAKRLGFGDAFDKPVAEHIKAVLEPTGITYEELLEKKCINPLPEVYIPFENGIFKTPTQKAEFFVYDWHEKGFNPMLTYIRAEESVKGNPELAAKYPLACVQRKTNRTIHSTFGSLQWLNQAVSDVPHVMIHPDDAGPRGIAHDDWVILYNDRGQHRCKANVSAHIKRGVVTAENGWWEQQGGSSSYITSDFVEHLSGGQSCNNTLVQVRKEG